MVHKNYLAGLLSIILALMICWSQYVLDGWQDTSTRLDRALKGWDDALDGWQRSLDALKKLEAGENDG